MARLTTAERNALPDSAFAGPDRSYPINDPSHARNALARASQHAGPKLEERIEGKVHKKYPSIGETNRPKPKQMGPRMKEAFEKGDISKEAASKMGYNVDFRPDNAYGIDDSGSKTDNLISGRTPWETQYEPTDQPTPKGGAVLGNSMK